MIVEFCVEAGGEVLEGGTNAHFLVLETGLSGLDYDMETRVYWTVFFWGGGKGARGPPG